MTWTDGMHVPENFDGPTYLVLNADVAADYEAGLVESPEQHWLTFGRYEGRAYTLPEVSTALGGGVFRPETFRYPYSSYGAMPAYKFESPSSTQESVRVCERLIAAWHKAKQHEPSQVDAGMWAATQRGHAKFYSALSAHDARSLSELLAGMFENRLTHGLAMGGPAAAMARHAPEQFSAAWCDKFLRLSEALGVVPVRSAEQSTFNAPLISHIENLNRVESALGFQLHLPAAGATWGVELHGTAFPEISLTHAYVAFRALHYLDLMKADPGSTAVAEIGGGFGGLAYFLSSRVRSYAIFDLPFSNLIQGYYLAMTGVPCAFYGEEHEGVRIVPWWCFYETQSFDLVINQDSIPEMPPEAGEGYIGRIKEVSRFFYSINQEAVAFNTAELRQLLVPNLIVAQGGYKKLSRDIFWLRDGYVEEFYEAGSDIQ